MWRSALGDNLLQESLNKEIAKLQSGAKRPVDREPLRQQKKYTLKPLAVQRSSSTGGLFASSPREGSLLAKVLSVGCLLAPLVAVMPYGISLFIHFPVLRNILLKPLLPLVKSYHSANLGKYFLVALMYGGVAKNRSMPSLARTVGLQASNMMMATFLVAWVRSFLSPLPRPMLTLVDTAIFSFVTYCVIVGAVNALLGKAASLPGIGYGELPSGLSRAGGSLGRGFRFRGGG